MAKRPEDRYQTPAELAAALATWRAGVSPRWGCLRKRWTFPHRGLTPRLA